MDNSFLVRESDRLRVRHDFDAAVTEVFVRGSWDPGLRTVAAHSVRACLAECPRAVLVDLSGLSDPAAESVATWHTAARYTAARCPASELILCGVAEPVRPRLDGAEIQTAGSVREARARLGRVPWTQRRQLRLPSEPGAAVTARSLAEDACHVWDMAHLVTAARLVMSELTANAVEHAGTDVVAVVSLRGPVLHLAVQDFTARLPQLIEHDLDRPGSPVEQRGAGLRLVRRAATAWGALPCVEGKVVWATLAVDGGRNES
ncbi:ATP-binding protein [Actinoplanes sp. NEAU-A12]|uniref:ATP-binding protein n=1 Tax=Actinoplanes sandaracinus TaxID=3045177 RepID=A0ABT6WZE1_9ACTN|nr:ATP-binding protein [Actinoplanes sandaracinus]MDI6105116.1 ATP-binding protein [Actinoplanes sandaracinus]